MPKLTRILFPLSTGNYRMLIGTGVQGSEWVEGSKKNADWTFSLGNEFQAKYWDGNEHKVFLGIGGISSFDRIPRFCSNTMQRAID